MRYNTHFLHTIRADKVFPFFLIPLFFVFVADATLAYTFPIIVESRLNSNTLLGIIMSLSSVAGLFCDVWFPFLFKDRSWKFQITLGLLFAMLFPLSIYVSYFFLPVVMFITASVVWGIYYEMIIFSEENFMVEEEPKSQYSRNWSILNSVVLIAAILGPILGEYISNQNIHTQLITILFIQLVGFIVASLVHAKHRKLKVFSQKKNQLINIRKAIVSTFSSWKNISTGIFTFVLILFILKLVESAFWMFGGLYAEYVGIPEGSHWLILTAYTTALLVGSAILGFLNIQRKKEMIATTSLFLGGLLLCFSYIFAKDTALLVFMMFVASLFISFVGPLRSSLFSEYINNLGKDRQTAIGLSCAIASLSYIIGPTLLGVIADNVGYAEMFSSLGILTIIISIYARITRSRSST